MTFTLYKPNCIINQYLRNIFKALTTTCLLLTHRHTFPSPLFGRFSEHPAAMREASLVEASRGTGEVRDQEGINNTEPLVFWTG